MDHPHLMLGQHSHLPATIQQAPSAINSFASFFQLQHANANTNHQIEQINGVIDVYGFAIF